MSRLLLRKLIGDVLRRHRLRQRRTLADVARDARVSMPYLSEVERGRKEASSEVLAAVCDALRIDLSDVLAEVWRDLAKDRAPVVSLELVRRRRTAHEAADADLTRQRREAAPPTGRRSGDVVLLAA